MYHFLTMARAITDETTEATRRATLDNERDDIGPVQARSPGRSTADAELLP